MKHIKIISIALVMSMLLGITCNVQAEEINIQNNYDIDYQLQSLYDKIAKELNIQQKYINYIYILLDIDTPLNFNIFEEELTEKPIEILNTNTIYQKADFIQCNNADIKRPSRYYMPDALYSITYDIASLMSQRYNYNRWALQEYFNTLNNDTKQDIIFYESLLLYLGIKEEAVNYFYNAYETILYTKQKNESITDKNGIRTDYSDILHSIGIVDENVLNKLAIIMSEDTNLILNDSIESLQDSYIVPYRLNYTSRENMMIAAMSLVGKVRYVWGGGHSGASYMNGINPLWQMWNKMYSSEPCDANGNNIESFGKCIKPSGSWCPIHGYNEGECSDNIVYSVDDYINMRKDILSIDELQLNNCKKALLEIDYTNGISAHTLDGLDCSGFASWLYNQITDKYKIDSTAYNFLDLNAVEEMPLGDEMLPGDVFAWYKHIVVIVGKAQDKSKVYVTVEQTTNLLKFGVLYYDGAKQSDIEYAKRIASEANQLIGGINSEYERPHVYCVDEVKYYTEQQTNEGDDVNSIEDDANSIIDNNLDNNELTEDIKEYAVIGRFKDKFIDEDTILINYDKKLKDMDALEIIQYTLSKLPISYVSGFNEYKGDLFNKSVVSSNIGISIE